MTKAVTANCRNSFPCLDFHECRREDSNLHVHYGHQVLNLARLPIPPLRLATSTIMPQPIGPFKGEDARCRRKVLLDVRKPAAFGRPSDTGSIAGQGGIDLDSPSVDTSGHGLSLDKPPLSEPFGHLQAALTMMTKDDQRAILVGSQFVGAGHQLTHRDV